ncbi:FHA domain-containing protein [Ketobacter sp. MCCC 1A13808]|uniref:FHA domain-containing protein n=1 Tax=Ketobacter sp. MCCC 1A13808 TaxID=2602738 RepID=UPI0012EC192F|nr:FHA domain-containing protein [Ketobacter sp. MCCC 1A13808]MVF12107.1 FHA domain-containing protein [Ketobacter sp. MCCC 1A13808]
MKSRLLQTMILFCASPVLIASVQAATVVKISAIKKGEAVQHGMASLVSDEVLLMNNLFIDLGDQLQVSDEKTGATIIGNVISTNKDADLALISAKGLSGEPFVLAREGVQPGRQVKLQFLENTNRQGTVHSILPPGQGSARVRHTIQVKENEFGAPLLNNCSELAGISQNPKRGFLDQKLAPSTEFSLTGDVETLKQFLEKNKIQYSEARDVCLSVQDLLEKERIEKQSKNKALEEIAKKQAVIEKQKSDLEILQKELEARNKEQEEDLKRKAEQLEEEIKKNEAALEAQKALEQQKAKKDEEIRQAKVAEENARKKQTYIISGLGILTLTIALVALISLRKKKQAMKVIEKESLSNKQQLTVELAKNESAQSELEKASASFNDILLVGTDEDQNKFRVKINGKALAQASDGQILGRSVQNSDYVINLEQISRQHIRITLVEGTVYFEDLGSFNGSSINDINLKPGTPSPIRANDRVRIGTISCKVIFME